jgi:hypothetical protein
MPTIEVTGRTLEDLPNMKNLKDMAGEHWKKSPRENIQSPKKSG